MRERTRQRYSVGRQPAWPGTISTSNGTISTTIRSTRLASQNGSRLYRNCPPDL